MTVNRYSTVDGHPIFEDTDAPDIKVDPTKVSEFAADVGTRIVRGSASAITSYAFMRPGMGGHDTSTGTEYVGTSAGPVPVRTLKTDFTPQWSGVTLGTSTNTGWWSRNGEFIEGEVLLVLATGWNFSSAVRLEPPVPILSPVDFRLGDGIFVDNGTGYYPATLVRSGSRIAPLFTDTPTGRLLDVVNTSPFAWTAGDSLRLSFRYRG